MGQHRALRRAGGAAGVLKHRDVVVDLDLDRRGPAGIVGQRAEEHVAGIARDLRELAALDDGKEQLLQPRQHLRHGADHEVGEPRLVERDAGLVVEDGEIEGDQDVGLGILDLALDLLDGVERVDVDDRPARLQHAVVDGDEVGAVGEQDADLGALADAELLEALGRAVCEIAKLAIGRDLVHEVDRRAVSELGDRIVEQALQRRLRQRRVPVDILRVGLLPGVGTRLRLALSHGLRSSCLGFAAPLRPVRTRGTHSCAL